MTVEELIEKLECCDPKAKVYSPNDTYYVPGHYAVDAVDEYPDGTVYLALDYMDREE